MSTVDLVTFGTFAVALLLGVVATARARRTAGVAVRSIRPLSSVRAESSDSR